MFTAYQQRYVSNFLRGPFALSTSELDSITDASKQPRYFVRIHGDKSLDTGVQEITVTKTGGVETGRSVSANYYLMLVGQKILIVKSPKPLSTDFTGELTPSTPAFVDSVLSPSSRDDQSAVDALRSRLYPFYLDDDSFREPGYIGIAAWLVFALLFWWLARRDWRWVQDPSTHPVAKRAEAWGDPSLIGAEAEQDSLAPVVKTKKPWIFGQKFVVFKGPLSFNIYRLSDLLWAYKKKTKHSVNLIPTGTTYAAALFFEAGVNGSADLPGKEKQVDAILQAAMDRVPWAIFGYSKELETAFAKEFTGFRGAIAERKAKAGSP